MVVHMDMEPVSIINIHEWNKIKILLKDGQYYPTNSKCFSGDSLVTLSNGQDKRIDSLNIGDEILTIDQSKLISTEIIMMLDKEISKEGIY